ncbi:MAG TPA: peptidoglycan DD-metalloendopeptidase family protein [Verrucomicrobiae bacterium]|nr:peptidoglycan DD-metalloendopeptidase family protein [Verrucomicrobiae bacterium]
MRAAIIAGLLLAAGASPAEDERANAGQLDKLRARIGTLQQALEADRGQQDELRLQLEDSERRFMALTAELAALRKQIAEQSSLRRRTEVQRREAEGQLRKNRTVLARQVRAAYIIGQRGQAKLVLNQDKSQRLTRVMTYYDYLNRARVDRIAKILEQAAALDALAQKLKSQTAELEATRGRHQGTLTALEAARDERQEMVRSLAQRIAGEEGELSRLRADERELSHLIEELGSALRDVPANLGKQPFVKLKGKLPWPLSGKLLAKYGDPKVGGRLKWNGLWIAGSEGDAVRSVARGRVAYVGWMHAYGLIVVLEHEGGYYSLYGHNQNVGVSIGDWVQPGDVLATVGATGGHDKSGLYFELRRGTAPINPRLWFKGRA